MNLTLLKVLLLAANCSPVALLFSPATPFSPSDLLGLVPGNPPVTIISIQEGEDVLGRLQGEGSPEAVLDYSYSLEVGMKMRGAGLEGVVGMYEGCEEQKLQGKLTAQDTGSGIATYLQALNFTRLFLAVSATPFYLEVARELRSHAFLTFTQTAYLHPRLSREDVRQFVGRVLKPAGSSITALLVDEETGAWLYPALQDFHIYRKGFAYLFSAEAVWGTWPDGALYVTDSAALEARNRLHYEALILADQLKSTALSNSRRLSLSLVNIQGSRAEPVTSVLSLLFPGNSTIQPSLTKPNIDVSADLSALNYDGESIIDVSLVRVATKGTIVGYADANRRTDIMTNLQFSLTEVNLGGVVFNKTWAVSQYRKHENSIGIAFNGCAFGGTAIAINALLAELGKFVPNTSFATSSSLSNSTEFPMFLRTSSSNASYVLVMLRFFRLFRWKRVAVVYASASGDVDVYRLFVNYSSHFDITILNDENHRMLPIGLESAQQQLNDTVQSILNSPVRVVVISHAQTEQIAERMYDFGARAGDYVICTTYGLSYTYFKASAESVHKRKAILKGALMFYDRYFSGTEGSRVRELLRASVGDSYHPMSCVFYDSAMLVSHAVSYMLARGLNYEDGRELMAEMRKTRFSGCIGIIQYESGSNDRRAGDYSVANLHVTGENETVEIVDAALYSPTKMQLFTLFPSFQFPDGSSTAFPDSWTEDEKCPYLTREIREFPKGRQISLLFCMSAALITGFVTAFTWCKYRHQTFPLLQQKARISIPDVLVLITPAVEFLQQVALALHLQLHTSVTRLLHISVFRFEELVVLSQGVFGRVVLAVIALISLLYVITVARVIRAEWRLRCGCIEFWWQFVLPGLSPYLFVPISFTLLSVFQCEKSVGESLSESFLNRDCHQLCWSGPHLTLAILSAVFLCGFIALSVPVQLQWQQTQTDLHIRTSVSYSLLKSLYQVLLAGLAVSLKTADPSMHILVYVILGALYFTLLTFVKPSNYERMNLWVRLLSLAVLLYGIITLATLFTDQFTAFVAKALLAIVCSLLLVTGLALQWLVPKYGSCLVRAKDDRYDIIKFAFTFGTLAQMHLRNFRAKHAQRYVEITTQPYTHASPSHNN